MNQADAAAIVRERNMFDRVRKACDTQNLPYPPDLIEFLQSVARYRG